MEATKGQRLAGWVVTGLVSLVFLGSGAGKLAGADAVKQNLASVGLPLEKLTTVGALEVLFVVIFLIPRTSFLGAILLTAYAGGAFFAHFRSDTPSPFVPLLLGILVWVGYGLRHPDVIRRASMDPSNVDPRAR